MSRALTEFLSASLAMEKQVDFSAQWFVQTPDVCCQHRPITGLNHPNLSTDGDPALLMCWQKRKKKREINV